MKTLSFLLWLLLTFLGSFCFLPGTLVDTQHGKRVIESLQAGDLVWAKDESTGEIALKPIAQTFERVAPSTLALTFSNGETIETTVEHPFYVQDKGFTPAGLVALGNSIVTRAGPSLQVTRIEKHSSPHKVYNFEVADFHTYFVGESALWTHNQNCVPILGQKLDYLLGKVTSSPHNTKRSADMLDQLQSIGLFDNQGTRNYLTQHLTDVLNDAGNIAKVDDLGIITRESLVAGPNGVIKMATTWDGNRLLTFFLYGRAR